MSKGNAKPAPISLHWSGLILVDSPTANLGSAPIISLILSTLSFCNSGVSFEGSCIIIGPSFCTSTSITPGIVLSNFSTR